MLKWFVIFALLGGLLVTVVESVFAGETPKMYPALSTYVEARIAEFDQIPAARKQQLDEIAAFVSKNVKADKPSKLTFICTHNSRRSQLAQVWAAAAAAHYGTLSVLTYSGGTESTAFNPRAVRALEQAGFQIERQSDGDNPVYRVQFSYEAPAITCSSKVYNESPNPREGFCAVMTCAKADKACPVVMGASERVAIPFEDPKAFDGTPQETEKYNERCAQIAREMLYVFSQVGT